MRENTTKKSAGWHSLSSMEVVDELNSDLEDGLTRQEAQARLQNYGLNKLPEATDVSAWRIFFAQFKNVMTILLLAAALIALILGDEIEAVSILAVLLLNALLGFANEYRAERSVQALRAMVVPVSKVIRQGETHEVPGAELVPGDLIVFEAGDRIPADARLVESWNLRLDESALTGESVPAEKDSQADLAEETPLAERQTMIYSGTAVVQGRGRALITATGAATEIGKISDLLQTTQEEQTPLQQRLDQLGRYLALAALAIAAVVAAVGIWRGVSLLPMLETSLALAIAAVPEGLMAVATIALALGMRRMAKRRAIIRRLAAVETLGSTNVICTDKTGTLTQNQMTVRELRLDGRVLEVSGTGYEPVGVFHEQGKPLEPQQDEHLNTLLRAGLLCNNAALARDENEHWEVVGDPTEGALIVLAAKGGLDMEGEKDAFPKIGEVPFDAGERRMATIHTLPGEAEHKRVVYAKGAPETILPACTHQQQGSRVVRLNETEREALWQANAEMSGKALRVLALAYKTVHSSDEEPYRDLIFLGFVGMMDPPRPEAQEAIRLCQQAGIRVVMITGDQKNTARAIASELGIVQPDATMGEPATNRVVDGQELEAVDEAALQELVDKTAVYARVSPEHKLRIVRGLQQKGQVVAMTGDGVNDAPALKAADIGVAMGYKGTDVAREAADMVLSDDNFATIVNAVEEGRVVFANVRKFVHYLFSCNLSEIVTMLVATLAGLPLPLYPLQILWLNLITDVFPALALAAEPAEGDIMRRPPLAQVRNQRPPASFIRSVIGQGALLAGAALAAFVWALGATGDTQRAMTVAFLTLGLAQLFHAFNSRFENGSVLQQGLFSNLYLWAAAGLTIVLMILAVYLPILQRVLKTVPPTLNEWGIITMAALLPVLLIELYKVVRNKA